MSITQNQYDATQLALAFARSFCRGDLPGADAMLKSVPVDELGGFVSTLAAMVDHALTVSKNPPDQFFDAFGDLIQRQDVEAPDGGGSEA